MSREKTRFPGVYKRTIASRRHNGKPDVCFDITYRDAAGKKRWEKVGAASEGYTAANAVDILRQRVQTIRHGQELPRDKKRLTLDDAWAIYSKRGLPGTQWGKTATAMWDNHIGPKFGGTDMAALKSMDIEAWRDELLKRGLAPQTVRHILGALRRLYRKASEWEIYEGRIPTSSVKMPKVDAHRLRWLTPDEARLLLEGLKKRSVQWYRIALLSLHTGMRLGEIAELRVRDISLSTKTLNIKDAKTGTRGGFLTEIAAAELAGCMPADPGALIFPSRTGGVIGEASETYPRVVEALGLNAGVDDSRDKVVFHTLRHTFGSWAAQQGVPLGVIADLMGHDTLEITRRYAKLAPDQKRQAMELVESMFLPTHDP